MWRCLCPFLFSILLGIEKPEARGLYFGLRVLFVLCVTSFILCQSYTLLFHQFLESTLRVRAVFIASFLSFNKKQWDGT